MSTKAIIGLTATGIGFVVAIILAIMMTAKIPAGFVGVVYSVNGGVTGEVKSQGWHFTPLFTKIMTYPISTETVYLTSADHDESDKDNSLMISTRDGKPVKVGIVYSYSMEAEKTPELFTQFRGRSNIELQNGFMKDRLFQVVQEVVSREGVLEVYSDKRSEINAKAFEAFKNELEPYGIKIESFSFAEVIPDEQTMIAIQATVDAQQEVRLLEVEQEKAEAEAERKRIEAEGNAEIRLIRAESQAEANRIVSNSITENLIRYNEIEKWDGVRSKVVGGDALVDVRN